MAETYQELCAQIKELQEKAQQVRAAEIAGVVADIKAKMAQYGITSDDLAGRPRSGKLPAKYRDPATGKEWSGRGANPAWLRQALAEGRQKSEFLIG